MDRSRRRVLQAAVVAGIAGGGPSTALAAWRLRSASGVLDELADATMRIGVLVPPFRPGFGRGVGAHVVISLAAAELLAHSLPQRRAAWWGAAAGLGMGAVNVGVIGRRIPTIAALPLGPQLADNVAFGVIFALVADRGYA